jgi:hypothetical protein
MSTGAARRLKPMERHLMRDPFVPSLIWSIVNYAIQGYVYTKTLDYARFKCSFVVVKSSRSCVLLKRCRRRLLLLLLLLLLRFAAESTHPVLSIKKLFLDAADSRLSATINSALSWMKWRLTKQKICCCSTQAISPIRPPIEIRFRHSLTESRVIQVHIPGQCLLVFRLSIVLVYRSSICTFICYEYLAADATSSDATLCAHRNHRQIPRLFYAVNRRRANVRITSINDAFCVVIHVI